MISIKGTNQLSAGFDVNDIDEAAEGITYIGQENETGAWYIIKLTDSANPITLVHATQNNNASLTDYTTAWAGRTSLTYGDYSAAF